MELFVIRHTEVQNPNNLCYGNYDISLKPNYEHKSKIFFERDIVFNPESEKSYLYLAKIFYEKSNDEEQEINLNNVLILNPQKLFFS